MKCGNCNRNVKFKVVATGRSAVMRKIHFACGICLAKFIESELKNGMKVQVGMVYGA